MTGLSLGTLAPGQIRKGELQLTDKERALIKTILKRYLADADVRVFGSRATGRARPFSDVDLLILEPNFLTLDQKISLIDAFEASDLPFCVDLLDYSQAPNAWKARALQESIAI